MRVVARFFAALLCALSASAAVMPSVTYVGEHASDAVKWQQWGSAAFERARREDKPIALGVGSFYSHETRVAHLALDGDAAAVAVLNERFVPILLDRAEWPLVSAAYAAAADRTDTDDLVIYAITPGMEWLDTVTPSSFGALQSIADRWTNDRDAHLDASRLAVRKLRAQLLAESIPAKPIDLDALDLSAVHDILGGGFHRAARDAARTVPFFEKRLIDQAGYARLHLDAGRHDVARSTLEYAVRDLQLPSGAFNNSQHADSLTPIGSPQLVEGVYYLWDRAEIINVFGATIGAKLSDRFGVTAEGNFPRFPGKNILRAERVAPPEPTVANAIAKLLEIRLHRPMPARDDAMAESSGRIIAQLARGGMMLDEPRYLRAAELGIASVARSLFDAKSNTLWRRPGVPATAADYAAVIEGAIEVYETTLEPKWLAFALRLEAIRDDRALHAVPEPVRDFVSRSAVAKPPLWILRSKAAALPPHS